jgi:hypothetical protein
MESNGLNKDLLMGGIIAAIPTLSMISMSLFVFKLEISKSFETIAQNFCAGKKILNIHYISTIYIFFIFYIFYIFFYINNNLISINLYKV